MLIDFCADDAADNNTTGYEEIGPEDVRQFVASHYTPNRMVLTGVGVDHERFVELAEEHFSNPKTSWSDSDVIATDQSISQYTGGHSKVYQLYLLHVIMETGNPFCVCSGKLNCKLVLIVLLVLMVLLIITQ